MKILRYLTTDRYNPLEIMGLSVVMAYLNTGDFISAGLALCGSVVVTAVANVIAKRYGG